MATAGYSGTPLLRKLGIKEEHKVRIIHAPENYFTWLEKDISHQLAGAREKADLIHLFAASRKVFEKEMQALASLYETHPTTIIWVSWYKKSAGMNTDMTEDVIRNYALANGLVDIKVCAVNEQWSGLKLVVPKAKR